MIKIKCILKIVEILVKHKPEIILLENVKNLKSHDKGNTYKIIENKLQEIDIM